LLWGVIIVLLLLFQQKNGLSADDLMSPSPHQEGNLVSLIQSAKPSIVAIGTYYFNDVPKLTFSGTGFSVGAGNLIITNRHVIAQIEEKGRSGFLRIFHKTFDPKGIKASVIENDEKHDISILQIESGSLPPLKLADSSTAREGEAVAFAGYPIGLVLGLNPTTHAGIISSISPIVLPSPNAAAITKDLVDFLRQPYEVFQIDATAYPGNSGSPLLRIADGKVIGVINMVFVKGKKEHILKDPTGITYAIPSNFIRELLKKHDNSPD
jgi:serine protease Do